jgi:hypothetical protein
VTITNNAPTPATHAVVKKHMDMSEAVSFRSDIHNNEQMNLRRKWHVIINKDNKPELGGFFFKQNNNTRVQQ